MPKKVFSASKSDFDTIKFLKKREIGYKQQIGHYDKIAKKLITSLEYSNSKLHRNEGGIFNLEFSLDGAMLAAACEKKSILLHDSLNRSHIYSLNGAHTDCVNCIRFLTPHTFASGSDDNTVKTWDLRFLKAPTRTLRGHSNWVKNIEYSTRENRLLTSAFDGGIYSWDLNNYTEQGATYDRVFIMDGLMRMKLTPDSSKMVLCTTHGYILIIHNLNLQSLNKDLQRFKPNIYRLMQESEQFIPIASCSNHLFCPSRKANRVELISDFPNTAEVISSLQIHPQGWCALSRNISSDELSEWTSVHDIQAKHEDEYISAFSIVKVPRRAALQSSILNATASGNSQQQQVPIVNRPSAMDLWLGFMTNQNVRAQRMLTTNRRNIGSVIRAARTSITVYNSGILTGGQFENSEQQENARELGGQVRDSRGQPRELRGRGGQQQEPQPVAQDDDGDPVDDGLGKIVENLPRLTHFMEEPNAGKGFIKELCFSADGRIICSPCNTGIRLFGFDSECSELSTCIPERPQRLHKIAHYNDYHSEIVVSCKFHPYHWLLVSGCLGGQIIWYNPVL